MTEKTHTQGLLRFITAGSVDDGKSTLIGRLLYDSKSVLTDQLQAIQKARHKRTSGEQIDFSLLTDGLEAEREQGITIDVAYRYFSTANRKFIIADTPGHEQYTRNMVTGASTADAAIVLVDIVRAIKENGEFELLAQTKRHTALIKLLGIRHVLVAVNKMDLVGFDEARFNQVKTAYLALARQLGLDTSQIHFIPVSALGGDNIVFKSEQTPWYDGKPLLSILESLDNGEDDKLNAPEALRLPVQLVIRQDGSLADDFRGYMGKVAQGSVYVGQQIRVLPANQTATVTEIITPDGSVQQVLKEGTVTIRLDVDIDISRGDMLVDAQAKVESSKTLFADICWFDEFPLNLKRKYLLKHTSATVPVRVSQIHHVLDVQTLLDTADKEQLGLNDIGKVGLSLQKPLVVDAYAQNQIMGSFILIDEASNNTVAAGIIN